MDVEPTPAHRTAEVQSIKTMIDRVEAQFDIKPERLIGEGAYGTTPVLSWMMEEKKLSNRMSLCRIKPSARTTVFQAMISTVMKRLRNIAACPATYCAANDEPSRMSVHRSPKPTASSFNLGRPTALRVQ